MDSRICFIQPPYGYFMQSLDAPFTLMYLAAVAERCGWKASIVDMTTPEDPLPEADVYAVTSTSPQWKEAQKLSQRLAKEQPDSLAIIGGVHVSACPEAFVDSDFHIAIQGEGEEPLTVMLNDLREHPELMKEYCIMRRGLEVKGIPIEDLDTVPYPARHLVDWSRYKRGIYWGKQKIADAVSIISSRGCPHFCSFCGSHVIFGRKTRFRSVGNVVAEIKQVKETMGYRGFNFHDDSVPAEETIPILENNVFKIVKIGDFIDNLLQEENIVEDERQIRYCMDLPIKVFSFNDKYDIEPTKIRRIIKHKTNKDVYQIVLASRRTVKVSRDHSVFMVKNGNIAPIAVSELEKGDWIVVPKRLSIPENMPIAIDTKQYKMVRKSRKSNSIKDSIMITEDLCWLLGMFVGDGCLSCDRRTITIFPSSIKLAEKCVTIFKDAIGLQGKIIDKTKSAWFCSTKAWQILRNGFQIILENGKRGSKRVPNLIYSLPIKYRKAFLKGYIEAEGHHNKNDDVYEISCNYKPLVNDIIYLLISIGENPKVYPTYHKQKDIHGYKIKIAINDIEQLGTGESYLRTRPYFSFHNKDLIVDNMEPTLKWHYKHKDLNPNGKTVIKSLAKKGLTEHNYDITADKIIEIKKIEPSGYLYDIEVEHDNGHDNFVGGFGGVCLHNTFALVPKRTLEMCNEFKNLDIFWRCLSRVDTITEELLDAMGGSGCREIVLGVESGSQKILNNLNKGVTVGQNLRAMKLIKSHKGKDGKRDIQVKAGIIVGSPGETWQTVRETEKLLKECPPDFWNVNVLSPFPGSPIWNNPERYGIKILSRDPSQYSMVGKNYQGTVLVETEEMTKSDIEQARDELIDLLLEISGPQYDL